MWIGTPEVGTDVSYEKAVFEKIGLRMTYFIDNIIAGFNNRGLNFDTIVKGIYMSDEAVIGTFDANTSITDHYQINMFQTVSNYAAGKGKKMLWSPYWDTKNFKNAACVIHRTNIFDYAVMQSHYYFSPSDSSHLNCAALRTGIAIQRVTYQSGRPILHAIDITCTKTVIGCQMEIDSDYFNNLDKDPTIQDRYKEYERVFNQSEGAYDKYNANFGFYFGCPQPGSTDDPGYDEVKTIVNNFFG